MMKIFIFDYVDKVSDNYHEGGGLAIVANDEAHARELIEKHEHVEVDDNEWKLVTTYELANEEEPKVFTFPDAGCC